MRNGSGHPPISKAEMEKAFAAMPLYFERNEGQTDGIVKYLSHTRQASIFITGDSTVISVVRGRVHKGPALVTMNPTPKEGADLSQSAVRIKLEGARPNPNVVGIDPLPGRVNYLIGRDPSKYHRNVPIYARVKVEAVYPGIDVINYGSGESLEYDFVVAPGADPSKIKLAIEGPAEITNDRHGNLLIKQAAGTIVMGIPRVYQKGSNGAEISVPASYRISNRQTLDAGIPRQQVGIEVADYDRARPLVIDPPILVYSSYLGGHASSTGSVNLEQFSSITDNTPFGVADAGLDVALDSSNDAYVTGVTFSNDFPAASAFHATLSGANSPPAQNPNAFVSKFDTTKIGAQSLVYSTYLGGSGDTAAGDAGHGNGDLGFGIAVDAGAHPFIVGQTYSTDFPRTNLCGAFGQTNDQKHTFTNVGFVAKMKSDGSDLFWACYIDGQNNATESRVALSPAGCGNGTDCKAYVAGSTQSDGNTGFPIKNAFQSLLLGANGKSNATFLVVHEDGQSLDYATLYGGTGNGVNADAGIGIAVDSSGRGYIAGATFSTDLVMRGAQVSTFQGADHTKTSNAFVAEFDPTKNADASLIYSTYLGGSGATGTIGFPINLSLSIGDVATGIAVDNQTGDLWVTGLTASTNFQVPGSSGTPFNATNLAATLCGHSANPPATAGFITQLNPLQSGLMGILYSTYFGGCGIQVSAPLVRGTVGFGDAVTDIQLANGKIYVVGATTGGTIANSFPLSANALACSGPPALNMNVSSGLKIGPATIPLTGFASELDPSQNQAGNQLIFSTLLGGTGKADALSGVAVDTNGNIVAAGFSYSKDFPVTTNALQFDNFASAKNSTNAFLTVINPTGDTCPATFPHATATATPTRTPTPSPTATPTQMATGTAAATPTSTTAATVTATATLSRTATPTSTATSTPTPTTTMNATPTATPDGAKISAPSSVSFKPVGIGLNVGSPSKLLIKNSGKGGGLIGNISSPGKPSVFTVSPTSFVVAPGKTATINLTCTPDSPADNDSITVSSNAANTPSLDVQLKCTGLAGKLSVPKSLTITSTGGKPGMANLVLKNAGKGVLTGMAMLAQPNPPFSGGGGDTGSILPGKNITITITFTPQNGSAAAGSIQLVGTSPGTGSTTVQLKGVVKK